MAVDVCSEMSSAGMIISPRISFSHDLKQSTDSVSIQACHARLDPCLLDSDFDFCISSSFVQELSSADELFSNGKILPVEIKKKVPAISTKDHIDQPKKPISRPLKATASTEKKTLLKELLSMSMDEEDDKPLSYRSFWQFKRSNSLNCDSTTRSKGLIRSLQFLSRSNSTGSAPNTAKPPLIFPKENQKPRLQKQHSVPASRAKSPVSFGGFYGYNSGQKHPSLRKCGSYGNGVRISPVLNIPPPPYISRGTVNLFGLGSLFCNGKIKRKKR